MKSLDFNQNAQYLVGVTLLPLPLPLIRQGDVLGLPHLCQPHIKVPEIAEGQHNALSGSRDYCFISVL